MHKDKQHQLTSSNMWGSPCRLVWLCLWSNSLFMRPLKTRIAINAIRFSQWAGRTDGQHSSWSIQSFPTIIQSQDSLQFTPQETGWKLSFRICFYFSNSSLKVLQTTKSRSAYFFLISAEGDDWNLCNHKLALISTLRSGQS